MHLRPAAALATLLTLAPAPGARAAAEFRLTPELGVGGGWASNLFVGSDFGEHWQGIVAPGLGAALSTGPVVKVFGNYRYTWSRYGTEAEGQVHEAGTTLRFRLSRAVDLDLDGDFLALAFSDPVAQDAAGPEATSSLGGGVSPVLRLRFSEALTTEAGYAFSLRESTTDTDLAIGEDTHVAFASATWRISPYVEAGLRGRHVSNDAIAVYSYDGDGATLFGAWAPFGDLVLRASLGLQWNRFEDGRRDRYGLASLSASWPLVDEVSAELAWSVADNASNDSIYDDTRHLTYAGLRAELPWWF